MDNDIFLIGEVGFEVTLENVVEKVKASNQDEPLNVHIHSGGGGVFEGLAIYNYLKGLDQKVNTLSSGLVASIASIIFLAGDRKTRTVNETDSFLIHLPSGGEFGNAEDLEKTAEELRDIEQKLAKIYALETDITKKQALDLMKKDEMMDISFLKEKGFVNKVIKFKAVATYKHKNNNNMSDNLTKKDAENLFEKFYNKFFSKTTNKVLQDAKGTEIEFPDVINANDPIIGDRATVDNKSADGEYLMPDGETMIFIKGKLDSIKEAEETELEIAQAKIDDLTEQLSTSAQLVTDKETEVTDIQAKFDGMKTDYTALRSKVMSNFNHNDKSSPKPNTEPTERQLFKAV